MEPIHACTEELLKSIQSSDVYLRYREKELMLAGDPELKKQVNTLRTSGYQIYQKEDWFEEVDRLNERFAQLRKIPEVNAYLEAELDLCKLLQKLAAYVVGSLDIQIPEV